ncbi:hypothetical protein WICPIJ_007903 [Wickerhamomyces pijperi]|uniref:Uncharacterized protein n=1 Tax=Wickerhamomyces pijperi TaxID=599730 RepID=A0A9P8PZC2_WICPI|nr:hypothetical protein WICPIJ_007903 [Wickerhamomyces pijperi]
MVISASSTVVGPLRSLRTFKVLDVSCGCVRLVNERLKDGGGANLMDSSKSIIDLFFFIGVASTWVNDCGGCD